MRPIRLDVVRGWSDPLERPPWGCELDIDGAGLAELVAAALAAGEFEPEPYSVALYECSADEGHFDLRWHARRVAYLMQHGWADAIELQVLDTGRVQVADGCHRLAASLLLGRKEIMVDVHGSREAAIRVLGQAFFDFPDLENNDFVQVSPDNKTLWVHALDGSTVGRFSWVFGLDIHTTISDQLDGSPQCLSCTHEPPQQEDWERFCSVVWQHYGIYVDRALMSERQVEVEAPGEEPAPVPCLA